MATGRTIWMMNRLAETLEYFEKIKREKEIDIIRIENQVNFLKELIIHLEAK